METNRHQHEQSEPNSSPSDRNNANQNRSAENGFEGMNFEEQRTSYKNSDGAGAKGSDKGSRNGRNER